MVNMIKKILLLSILTVMLVPTIVKAPDTQSAGLRDILCDKTEKGGWDCSIDQKNQMDVHGTEYTTSDTKGKVWLELIRDNEYISNASCYLTTFYHNTSYWIDTAPMLELQTQNDTGIYYYDFEVPSEEGVYMARASCKYPTDKRSHKATNLVQVNPIKYVAGTYDGTHERDSTFQRLETYPIGSPTGSIWDIITLSHSLEWDLITEKYTILQRDALHLSDDNFTYINEINIDLPSLQCRGHEYVGDYLYIMDRDGLVWEYYRDNYTATGNTWDLTTQHTVGTLRDLEYINGSFYTVDSTTQEVHKYDDNFNLIQTWDTSSYTSSPTSIGGIPNTECLRACAWVVNEDSDNVYRMDFDNFNYANFSYDISNMTTRPRDLIWNGRDNYFYLLDAENDLTWQIAHGCQHFHCLYYTFNMSEELGYIDNIETLDLYFAGYSSDGRDVLSVYNWRENRWIDYPNLLPISDVNTFISNSLSYPEEYVNNTTGEVRIGLQTYDGSGLDVRIDWLDVQTSGITEENIEDIKGSSEVHVVESKSENYAKDVWRRLYNLPIPTEQQTNYLILGGIIILIVIGIINILLRL